MDLAVGFQRLAFGFFTSFRTPVRNAGLVQLLLFIHFQRYSTQKII